MPPRRAHLFFRTLERSSKGHRPGIGGSCQRRTVNHVGCWREDGGSHVSFLTLEHWESRPASGLFASVSPTGPSARVFALLLASHLSVPTRWPVPVVEPTLHWPFSIVTITAWHGCYSFAHVTEVSDQTV